MSERPAWRVNSGMLATLTGSFRAQNPPGNTAPFSNQCSSSSSSSIFNFKHIRNVLFFAAAETSKSQSPFSLLVIKIDDFSQFEQNYGPFAAQKANEFLEDVLCCSRNLIFGDNADFAIGRYVDNRYLMVLPSVNGSVAEEYAEYLRKAIVATPFVWNYRSLYFTVSIGIASKPGHTGDQDMLIMQADQACDQMIACGGNRVVTAEITMRGVKAKKY